MAREVSVNVRNWGNAFEAGFEPQLAGWCARYDSRPDEKANEPKGRAESERRSRGWDGSGAGLSGIDWVEVEVSCARVAESWASRRAISSLRVCSSALVVIEVALLAVSRVDVEDSVGGSVLGRVGKLRRGIESKSRY